MEHLVRNLLFGDELSRLISYTRLKNAGYTDKKLLKYCMDIGLIVETKYVSKDKKTKRKPRKVLI